MNIEPLANRLLRGTRPPNERVPEADALCEVDESFTFRGSSDAPVEAELLSGIPEQRGIAFGFGGGEREERLRVLRQLCEPLGERMLELAEERSIFERGHSLGEFCSRPGTRKLDQRERIPVGLGDDPIANDWIRRTGHHRIESLPASAASRPESCSTGKPREIAFVEVGDAPSGDDDHDAFGNQTPGDEVDRLRRRAIKPLSVVHDPQQRLELRDLSDKLEHRHPHEEPIRRRADTATESDFESGPGRTREIRQVVEHGLAELLQTRVRKLHLGFDAEHRADTEVLRHLGHFVEQSRLPDAGLATNDDRTTVACSGPPQQARQTLALAGAAQQFQTRRMRGSRPFQVDWTINGVRLGLRVGHDGSRLASRNEAGRTPSLHQNQPRARAEVGQRRGPATSRVSQAATTASTYSVPSRSRGCEVASAPHSLRRRRRELALPLGGEFLGLELDVGRAGSGR